WSVGIMLDSYLLQQYPHTKLSAPDPVRTAVGNAIGSVVEQGMVESLGEESLAPALTSRLLTNPVGLTQQVMQVSQSDAMRTLFSDPQAQQLMLGRDTESLQKHPHFKTLMAMPEAEEIFTLLGEKRSTGQNV